VIFSQSRYIDDLNITGPNGTTVQTGSVRTRERTHVLPQTTAVYQAN
jgi:hypothetical protein